MLLLSAPPLRAYCPALARSLVDAFLHTCVFSMRFLRAGSDCDISTLKRHYGRRRRAVARGRGALARRD